MLDLTEFSLAQWRETSRAEVRYPDTPGKGRDLVDAFATVAWIRMAVTWSRGPLSALNGKLKLGRESDPSGHLNNYPKGRHSPSPATLASVEAVVHGATAVFEHLLWSVLRVREPALQAWDSWFSRMSPVDQRRVRAYVSSGKLRPRDRKSLEEQSTPEALAVMIALMRRDVEISCVDRAAQWVAPIINALVQLRPTFEDWGCAHAVEQYLGEVIFEQLSARGCAEYTYYGQGFASLTRYLQAYRDHQRAQSEFSPDRWADAQEAVHVEVTAVRLLNVFSHHMKEVGRVGSNGTRNTNPAVFMWVKMRAWAIAGSRYRLASLDWNNGIFSWMPPRPSEQSEEGEMVVTVPTR